MKKIYFLICTLLIGLSSKAQTVILPGGDMENWRSNSSGTTNPMIVSAPLYWFGADSLFVAYGEALGGFAGIPDTVWHLQLFEEDTTVHSGSHSAKLIAAYQDTLIFPGVLSNAKTHVNTSMAPPYITGISYSGGTPVTLKPTSVSAWVQYLPGKDTSGVTSADTGILNVEAISTIHGYDSIIGSGSVAIPPYTSWTQVIANITYPLDTTDFVDTLRVTFLTSGGGTNAPLDSSIMYVDDVTMTGTPQISRAGVMNVTGNNELMKVFPNPATGTIYMTGPQNAGLDCTFFSLSGKTVLTKALTGDDAIDIGDLPAALYFYTIFDKNGNAVQRGKVSVVK